MKLLFIGSHFAAHDDKVDRRNADYARIKAGLSSSHSYSSLADLAGASSGNLSELSNPNSARSSPPLFSSSLRTLPGSGSNSGSPTLGDRLKASRHKLLQQHHQQQQSESGLTERCTASASPRGWLSGLWRPCITPITTDPSRNDAADAPKLLLHYGMHKSAHHAHGSARAAGTEVSMQRAASCPSVPGAGSSSLQVINQQQAPGAHNQCCSMVSSHPVTEDSPADSSQIHEILDYQPSGCFTNPMEAVSLMPGDSVRRQIIFSDTFDPVSKQNRDSLARGSR